MMEMTSNTAAEFTNKLPQRVELTGNWEVGLLEIMYPMHSFNVEDESFYFYITWKAGNDPSPTVHTLKRGFYSHRSDIVQGLRVAQRSIRHRFSRPQTPIQFRTYAPSRFVVKNLAPDKIDYIVFSESLARLLGFSSSKNYGGDSEHRSITPTDLLLNTRNMFVYCDIVERSFVGDTSAPLLRVIKRVNNEGVETSYAKFNPVQYINVQQKSFDTIKIRMCTDDGRVMPFVRGKTILVLHFRRVASSNLLL